MLTDVKNITFKTDTLRIPFIKQFNYQFKIENF